MRGGREFILGREVQCSLDVYEQFLAMLSRGLDGGASELGRGGIERGPHAFPGFGCLHAVQERIELHAQIVQGAGTRLEQRIEFIVGQEHGS